MNVYLILLFYCLIYFKFINYLTLFYLLIIITIFLNEINLFIPSFYYYIKKYL